MNGATGASVSFERNASKGMIPERFEAVRSDVNGSRRDSFFYQPMIDYYFCIFNVMPVTLLRQYQHITQRLSGVEKCILLGCYAIE